MQIRPCSCVPEEQLGDALRAAASAVLTATEAIAVAENFVRLHRDDPTQRAQAEEMLADGLAVFAETRAVLLERGIEVVLDA